MATSQLKGGPYFFKPLVSEIEPVHFKLPKDDTTATAYPIYSPDQLHSTLIDYMWNEFNYVIEEGLTYPQADKLTRDEFIHHWFHSFCVVAIKDGVDIQSENNWEDAFLGTFYIKPNYMARCSHNCNAGFLVNHLQRGQKIGYRLGQVYLKWGALLGYKYSVFNLVFVTNVASWKLWDKFKFDRIGLLPRAAILKGHQEPIDAIIYGRDLTKVDPELLEGIGTDIVFIPRISRLLTRFPPHSSGFQKLTAKFMHQHELKQLNSLIDLNRDPTTYIAGVWATKECVWKAMASFVDPQLMPPAITVYTKLCYKTKDNKGVPSLVFDPKFPITTPHHSLFYEQIFYKKHIKTLLSISHDENYLVGFMTILQEIN